MTVKSSFAPSLALALAGLATPFVPVGSAEAQTLRVASTSIRDTLSVAMNRAVVVDSDTPFVELSIANPGIADISTLSDRSTLFPYTTLFRSEERRVGKECNSIGRPTMDLGR